MDLVNMLSVMMRIANVTAMTKMSSIGCIHYWNIAEPEGDISVGICKLCKQRREFKNFVDNWYLDDRYTREWIGVSK